jgi:hypothetical protein
MLKTAPGGSEVFAYLSHVCQSKGMHLVALFAGISFNNYSAASAASKDSLSNQIRKQKQDNKVVKQVREVMGDKAKKYDLHAWIKGTKGTKLVHCVVCVLYMSST